MGPVEFSLGPVKSTVDLSMEDHLQKLVSSTGRYFDSLDTWNRYEMQIVNSLFSLGSHAETRENKKLCFLHGKPRTEFLLYHWRQEKLWSWLPTITFSVVNGRHHFWHDSPWQCKSMMIVGAVTFATFSTSYNHHFGYKLGRKEAHEEDLQGKCTKCLKRWVTVK